MKQSVDVRVHTSTTIDPLDSLKVPAMIERSERKLRGLLGNYNEAARILGSIEDARVLPALNWGIASGDYTLVVTSVSACAKFEDDLALACIRQALGVTAADIKTACDPTTARNLTKNIRLAAAHALGASRHPDALKALRTLADAPEYGVRLTVLQRIARRGLPEDVAVARAMRDDKHPTLRSEANRLLKAMDVGGGEKAREYGREGRSRCLPAR